MLRRVYAAATRPFYAPRLSRIAVRRPGDVIITRAFHEGTGDFTTLAPDGTHSTKVISVYVGDPGESYVMIPTEIGDALRAATSTATSTPHPDRLPLTYFYDTKHFAAGKYLPSATWCLAMADSLGPDSSPSSPRLFIPQQLPRQSAAVTSPATLYLYGLMHQIAIDGTPDGTSSRYPLSYLDVLTQCS